MTFERNFLCISKLWNTCEECGDCKRTPYEVGWIYKIMMILYKFNLLSKIFIKTIFLKVLVYLFFFDIHEKHA